MLVNNISWFESTPTNSNVGLADRIIRSVLAVVFIGQILFVSGAITWQPYLVFVGIYLAMTTITSWDPVYQMLGFGTDAVSLNRPEGVDDVRDNNNIGRGDRISRAVLAAVSIGQILFVSGVVSWQPYLVFVGIYLAMTAITSWDPIYQMLHLATNNRISLNRRGGVNNVASEDVSSSPKQAQPIRMKASSKHSEHRESSAHDQAA